MYQDWLLRAPFAASLLYHGAPKLVAAQAMSGMLGLPVWLTILVGIAEVLAGIGIIAGGLLKTPLGTLATRLAGLAAAPVLLGAIVMVHAPRWSFVPTESHPLGGMEFQVTLLGIALFFLLTGGRSKEVDHG